MNARRGLLHLGLAKDYELITLYVGFSQVFPLTQNEEDHIKDSPDLFLPVRDVLYLRIGLILETMRASDQGAEWFGRGSVAMGNVRAPEVL